MVVLVVVVLQLGDTLNVHNLSDSFCTECVRDFPCYEMSGSLLSFYSKLSHVTRRYRRPERTVDCIPLSEVCRENTMSVSWDKGRVTLVYLVIPTGPQYITCKKFILFLHVYCGSYPFL